jgi:Trypsin-like peptidase domain
MRHTRWIGLALLVLGVTAPVRPAPAQDSSGEGKANPKGFDDLAEAGDWVRKRILVVGRNVRAEDSDSGVASRAWGTAFVISRKHRLLATNAHVADLIDLKNSSTRGVVADTNRTFHFDKVYYHPGVLRMNNRLGSYKNLPIYSVDRKEGDVAAICADVAVLHVTEDGGELPEEVTLASWDEIQSIIGRPIAALGFPVQAGGLPNPGVVADGCEYAQGYVTRLSHFLDKHDITFEEKQRVEHSAGGLGGSSGSPIFLKNGHVIALHNSGGTTKDRSMSQGRYFGVRIDCLWELLAYHKLSDQVAFKPGGLKIETDRHLKMTPDDRKLTEAWTNVTEAYRLALQKEYKRAIDLCDKALSLHPKCTEAYETRSEVRLWHCHDEWRKLSTQEKKDELDEAFKDAVRASKDAPYGAYLTLVILNNVGFLTKDRSAFEKCQELSNTFLGNSVVNTNPKLAALTLAARATARFQTGDKDGALKDFNTAVGVMKDDPDPSILMDRGNFFRMTGKPDLAEQDIKKAERLRRKLSGQD